jgi:D-sedoheptulose 7-phosphate isomerase
MSIKNSFSEAQKILDDFISSESSMGHITTAGELIVTAFKSGNKVISCGNGGSMCDAMHFAEELSGRFRNDRPALPAISISDPSHITCVGNDYGFDHVFSRYIEAVGSKGDALLAISTSGNSANIIRAAEISRSKGIKVIGLTGKDGGKLASLCDIEIRAPFSQYADRAQEIHIKVIHALIGFVESKMF